MRYFLQRQGTKTAVSSRSGTEPNEDFSNAVFVKNSHFEHIRLTQTVSKTRYCNFNRKISVFPAEVFLKLPNLAEPVKYPVTSRLSASSKATSLTSIP
jgi:hypothetical protein